MKVCCNSHSYARMLSAGELTQLEWVDLCANDLGLDGVEFATAHFPRLDADYIAQLKKLCADRCLTVASLHHDAPFDSNAVDEHVEKISGSLELAAGLGAPIVRLRSAGAQNPPTVAWRELIRGLKSVCIAAKQRNITLALEPCDDSLVSSPVEAKRALKECDSAWLRLAPSAAFLGGPKRDEWIEALEAAVFAVAPMSRLDTFGADETLDYIAALTMMWQQRYRGFLSLDYSGEEDERAAVARAVAWLRGILPKDALGTAVT